MRTASLARCARALLLSLSLVLTSCNPGPPPITVGVTGDPALPFVSVDDEGTVVAFSANPATGAPTAITVLTADGREGVLAIDEATGYPLYWMAEGWVVTFGNVRTAERLVDVGVIAPDGTETLAIDVELPAPQGDVGEASAPLDEAGARGDLLELLDLLDVAVTMTGCVGGILLVGGATLGGATVPVAAVPLFASAQTTAAGTAVACAATAVKLRALRADARMIDVNDTLVAPVDLGAAVADCADAPGVAHAWHCIKIVSEVVRYAANSRVRSVMVSYLRLTQRAARLTPYTAYCCNGPDQVEVGSSARWRAAVVDGLGTTPFTYGWDFGDATPGDYLVSDGYAHEHEHRYLSEGTFPIAVTVRDAAGNEIRANASGLGTPLTTFDVRVYGELGAECCRVIDARGGEATAVAGEPTRLAFELAGGRLPYAYDVTFGDGGGISERTVSSTGIAFHAYEEPGTYEVVVRVTDADGAVALAPPFSLAVEAEGGPPPTDPVPVTTCSWHSGTEVCTWFYTDCTLEGQAPIRLVGDPAWPHVIVDRPGTYRAMNVLDLDDPSGARWVYAIDSDAPLPTTLQYGDYSLPGTTRNVAADAEPPPLRPGGRYELNFFTSPGGVVEASAMFILAAGSSTADCDGR